MRACASRRGFCTVRRSRTGVSTAIAAVVLIIAFVIAGVGGYLLVGSGSSTSTTSLTTSLTTSPTSSTTSATSSPTSSTTTSSSSSTTTGNETAVMASLAAAAEAECTSTATCLTIYTTQDAGNWAEYYGPAFDQQYPWAAGKVQYVSLDAADETTELIAEYQTHGIVADIADGTLAQLMPVYQAGGFMNYTSPIVQFMNYSATGVGPAWVDTDLAVVNMEYNPTLLPANEVPTSWSALANPIYNNKIAFQDPSALSITTAEFYYLYTSLGNSSGQWNTLMKGIAANHPRLEATAGDAEADVLNGQAAIGVDTLDSYVTAVQGGPTVPLKFVDIEPLVYTPGALAITAGAPHPAMAELVEAWFISDAGQKAICQTNHIPYQTSLCPGLLSYLPSDYKLVDAYSSYANTVLFQNPGGWSDTFESIFGIP